MTLPIPFENYVPKLLKDSLPNDAAGTALVNKADVHLQEWSNESLEIYYLKWPERCPSSLLEELGNYLAAGIFSFDSETTKRQKIYNAIDRHKRRGSWENDAKLIVDAICGNNSSLVEGYFEAQWLFWAKESGDLSDYSATLGDDGIDDDLGIDLIGIFTECVIEGVVCIDCDSPIEQSVAKVQAYNGAAATDKKGATLLSNGNFVIYYGTAADINFVIYDNTGNLVKSEVEVNPALSGYGNVFSLADGSFVCLYQDTADGNKPKFKTYDIDGTLISSGTINNNACTYITGVAVGGQKWVVAWNDTVATDGLYRAYEDDTALITEQIFESITSDHISVEKYNTDQFIVAYRDTGDANKGKFRVYDIDTTLIISETKFSDVATSFICITMLDESNSLFAIGYKEDVGNTGQCIYYKANTIYVSNFEFTSNTPGFIDTAVLDNSNLIISYRDTTDNKSKMIIYSVNGDLFKRETIVNSNFSNSTISISLGNNTFVFIYSETTTPELSFIIYTEGLGAIHIEQLIASMERDVVPAYMKIRLGYYDPDSSFFEIYPNGTMG